VIFRALWNYRAKVAALCLFCCAGSYSLSSLEDYVPDSGYLDPRSFGAKCDGKTDDSRALQVTVDNAISGHKQVILPSGTCIHSSTLRLNKNERGVDLAGRAESGVATSYLRYTGKTTGYQAINETGNKFIYQLRLSRIALLAGSGEGARTGIEAAYLSEALFDQIGWWSSNANSKDAWKTAFHCLGCNIVTVHRPVAQFTERVFDLNSVAAFFVDDMNMYQNKIAFRFSGGNTNVVIRDGWFEMQDVAILLDATVRNTSMNGLFVHGNRFLFNAQKRFDAPNQVVMKYVSERAFALSAVAVNLHDNTAYFAPGMTKTDYAVLADLRSKGSTSITTSIHDNSFVGANKGIAISNRDDVSKFLMHDNYSVDAKLQPHNETR
jgi:hypothetical protein